MRTFDQIADTIYMYLRSEGVILSHRNFGEADRLLTIYTRDFGKLSAIAKGVRRPRSKKAGHVELGSLCKVFIAKGKNLDLLTEVESRYSFGITHFSQDKANKIYHLLEIVESLTPTGQKNPQVFSLLVSALKKIEKEEDFNLISSVFKIKLLKVLGFFSTKTLSWSKTRDIIEILEEENFEDAKNKLSLSPSSYLKLLAFLDSMIEDISGSNLKTARFL